MEPPEFEGPNPLQILLLAFVELGLATPYDLLSKAGLGAGLTSPALKRLESAGLLKSTPGPRKRVRYVITENGEQVLRKSLYAGPADYWQQGQIDVFESLPRSIVLAWLDSGIGKAQYTVSRAADHLLVLSSKKDREAKELNESMMRLETDASLRETLSAKGLLVATAYRWIKAESDAILFRLQAQATEQIIQLIEKLPSPPIASATEDAPQ